MPTYDAAWFTPPAPLIHVRLRNSQTGTEVTEVPMLLDTGADVSLVPRLYVTTLDLALDPERRYELIGFDDTVSTTPVVQLELYLLRRRFRGQFLLIDQEWGIIGRNILNQLPILLDGPRQTWDLHR
jgi:Retroviral aspartyl protease